MLGLGCTKLGSIAANLGWRASQRLVHRAVDLGVTFFDTADAYGGGASEHVLGRALRGRHGGVTVATKGGYRFRERSWWERRARMAAADAVRLLPQGTRKVGLATATAGAYGEQDFSPTYLTAALDASLRRLGTDRIDLYQFHAPRDVDPDTLVEWSSRMRAAGKIDLLGIGAEDLEQAATWSASGLVGSVQVPFGILDPGAGVTVIPQAAAKEQLVVVRGVLGGGLLAEDATAAPPKAAAIAAVRDTASQHGVSVAQTAIWFVRRRDDIDVVLVGTSKLDHLDEIVASFDTPVPSTLTFTDLERVPGTTTT